MPKKLSKTADGFLGNLIWIGRGKSFLLLPEHS